MARGGIYKAEVLRARDKLLALRQYPSIDAIRTELGNTGSKSTIHRYLKEIEEEEGPPAGPKVAVSEAIQDLVGRLAGRLQEEAEVLITESSNRYKAQLEQQASAFTALKDESEGFRLELQRNQLMLANEKERHAETRTNLEALTLERATLIQQVVGLDERLAGEEQHRKSLEEKHQHAREALEHFRQSAKDQREQEQRQHDQQVQYLQAEVRKLNQTLAEKQHESIHSNQENARLTGQVARAESDLHNAQTELRALRGAQEELIAAERNAEDLRRQVAIQAKTIEDLVTTNIALETESKGFQTRIRQLEVDLASARASATTEGQITGKINALIEAAIQGIQHEPKSRTSKPKTVNDQELLFKTDR